MDLPPNILGELKCSRCEIYLSRSPVYLQHDEQPICSICYTPEQPATRNRTFETVAQFIKFPCKYQDRGCPETVAFDNQSHEDSCKYRQYTCPILGANYCDWHGRRDAILNHCLVQHLDRVVLNQASLTYDFSKSNLKNYLLVAFNLIFLLHTKICLTNNKIYHSVRLIGSAALSSKYYFTVNVNYNNSTISRERDVEPEDFLTIYEHTSIHLKLDSFKDLLGGYEGAQYNVTIFKSDVSKEKRILHRIRSTTNIVNKEKENKSKVKSCDNNKKCTYVDFDLKCTKHKLFYCKYQTVCQICNKTITERAISRHYVVAHKDIFYKCDANITIKNNHGWIITEGVGGLTICYYRVEDNNFKINVCIPVSTVHLKYYICNIHFLNPDNNKLFKLYKLNRKYDTLCDWVGSINLKDLPVEIKEFDVSIEIKKINKLLSLIET